MEGKTRILWRPSQDVIKGSNILRFVNWLNEVFGFNFEVSIDKPMRNVHNYDRLWRWSAEDLETFWVSIWRHFGVIPHSPYTKVLEPRIMPGARWFIGSRLNYTEHVFRASRWGEEAIIYVREDGFRRSLTWDQLYREVAALSDWLKGIGIGRGDRVAAYVSQVPEAVVALLATASIGAIWVGVGAELAPRAVIDRFNLLQPKVLIAVDGYPYRGRVFDKYGDIKQIVDSVQSIGRVVIIPNMKDSVELSLSKSVHDWREITGRRGVGLSIESMEFNEPLWVLFTSGTTGIPKPVVHSHGGVLLEAYKVGLHMDYKPSDKFTWYTTPSWMMWNFTVNALLFGATILFYDGDPTVRNFEPYWEITEKEGLSILGLSAPYIHAAMKSTIEPGMQFNLGSLREIGSTAAPLSPQGFEWVYGKVKEDVWLAPISGGTDVVSALVGGCPILPVWEGEMQCKWLGAAVNVYDEEGRPVVNEVGELVIERPMPSMPIYFWNDPDYNWYRESYFGVFPGVWRHGDWAMITDRGTVIITGRSDSTIKRKGIRIGTLDIYRVVESLPEVVGSLAVEVKNKLVIFVALRPGLQLTEELKKKINDALRNQLGPYYIADYIIQVPDIPMTRNYKKLEVPIKKVLMGWPIDKAVNINAVLNPEAFYAVIEALKPYMDEIMKE
ncbi:acetoacetate--CoA ligase [Vulcanisaeta souniana]|uniref:Acetoacetyl-CoA synthetase n=1 Tax=Vulcanisaeta souniana JCM 11219 TaxID=1293586 RepID=A0A830E558_9CREN|nr:acetoacetate--CoA ligase [Vulcanisaeta souniana]BDR93075.1 acetoacetyl-CoA synthetase [Vulcanisaeta souniana JCM 11219]GGI87274.1 acetoacetyl-CoA synthetase [Vulcanisaeta souniana JCM 11219]